MHSHVHAMWTHWNYDELHLLSMHRTHKIWFEIRIQLYAFSIATAFYVLKHILHFSIYGGKWSLEWCIQRFLKGLHCKQCCIFNIHQQQTSEIKKKKLNRERVKERKREK